MMFFAKSPALVLVGVLTMLISACSDETATSQQGAGQMPPPPPVSVAEVLSQEISDWEFFTGRLEASDSITVRPRASGYIVSVGFKDGARVKKGDLLFQVDYRTVQAQVEQLEADLNRAQAQIELTERDLKRATSLLQSNSISQEQLDNRRTLLTQAKAEAESVRADLRRAKVLLAITTVNAEFDGRVSNARVEVGSSVIAGETVLTTLVSTDTVHAYFDAAEQTFQRLKKMAQGQALESMGIPVFLGLVGEPDFPHQGQIDFVDNQIDITTGTIRLRAAFDNKDGIYTPGMFVRLKLAVGKPYQAVLVDERAIGTDLNNKYVLVLGEDNVVSYRPVTLGQRSGKQLRVIKEGLEAGEKIVVKGLQRVRPGTPVTPNEIDMIEQQ